MAKGAENFAKIQRSHGKRAKQFLRGERKAFGMAKKKKAKGEREAAKYIEGKKGKGKAKPKPKSRKSRRMTGSDRKESRRKSAGERMALMMKGTTPQQRDKDRAWRDAQAAKDGGVTDVAPLTTDYDRMLDSVEDMDTWLLSLSGGIDSRPTPPRTNEPPGASFVHIVESTPESAAGVPPATHPGAVANYPPGGPAGQVMYGADAQAQASQPVIPPMPQLPDPRRRRGY